MSFGIHKIDLNVRREYAKLFGFYRFQDGPIRFGLGLNLLLFGFHFWLEDA